MDWHDYMHDLKNDIRALNKTIPDTTKAFGSLSKQVKDSGVLDVKTKEFIALAIAVAQGCEPCIAFHAEVLAKHGAPRDEVGDALAMAIQMGGGPALMYAAKALKSFDAFHEK
ncbi:MAG: carboxymuconolactone decarboxylase family protein [Brevirhabdus sp.]